MKFDLVLNKENRLCVVENKVNKSYINLINGLITFSGFDGFYYDEELEELSIDVVDYINDNLSLVENIKNECKKYESNEEKYYDIFDQTMSRLGFYKESNCKIAKDNVEMMYDELERFFNKEEVDERFVYFCLSIMISFLDNIKY